LRDRDTVLPHRPAYYYFLSYVAQQPRKRSEATRTLLLLKMHIASRFVQGSWADLSKPKARRLVLPKIPAPQIVKPYLAAIVGIPRGAPRTSFRCFLLDADSSKIVEGEKIASNVLSCLADTRKGRVINYNLGTITPGLLTVLAIPRMVIARPPGRVCTG